MLLYALYAAKGIPAEIVLVNNTDDATIADPPNVRPMNHLILYLPGPGLYLNSTVPVAPFAVLPFGELGKPAIHMGEPPGGARRQIPLPPSGDTEEDMKTDMTFTADGTVSGTTTTTARGAFGSGCVARHEALAKINQPPRLRYCVSTARREPEHSP